MSPLQRKGQIPLHGPDRTRTDPHGLFRETLVSDKVRGLCLVGSGRARVVELSYNTYSVRCVTLRCR